ncbi:hypothetical protein KAX17_07370, partial [Candidatus Bipolaricaulota bacterium]|nr:hypothetical protein [Candidatus Bipolaricaulota bacterium]
MKKALVMTVVLVLGLGFAASAVSLAGEWSGAVEFDPGAVAFADFLTDFSSDLSVTYSIGSLSVTSETGFDSLGYASQAFSAEVTLGAFIFASEMSFLPRAVLTETITYDYTGSIYDDFDWGPPWPLQSASVPQLLSTAVVTETTVETFGVAFDEWTTEASLNIAGVNLGALFYMKDFVGTVSTEVIPVYDYEWATIQTPPLPLPPWLPPIALTDSGNPQPFGPFNWWEYMTQTATYVVDNSDLVNRGAGWRFMISGELSPVKITSYTYFNLIEGFAMDDDPDTKSFDRNGEFTIAEPDQIVRFTEEYIVIEGLSLGCIE